MFEMFKNLFTASNNNVDNTQLKVAIKNGALLVDVRSPSEFSSGSVKGAINIPLDKIPSQLSKFKNKKNIVVFCRSGARSAQAKMILQQSKIENVMNGGTWLQVNNIVNNL